MSACISLFGYWHKIQPHTHTLTHTHQGGKEAAKKGRWEVSRKERDGGRRKEEGGGGHLVLCVYTASENCVAGSGPWSLSEGLMFLSQAAHIHFNNLKGASEHQCNLTVLSDSKHFPSLHLLSSLCESISLSNLTFLSLNSCLPSCSRQPYLPQLIYSEAHFLSLCLFILFVAIRTVTVTALPFNL